MKTEDRSFVYDRHLGHLLAEAVRTRPVVYLNGPRQVGKSTLARVACEGNYLSFDSPLLLSSASASPEAFLASLPTDTLNIVDEVQLVPALFRQMKRVVDESRLGAKNAGLFLLTGSANLLALPKLSQALAGRMSVLTLLPFSVAERRRTGVRGLKHLTDEPLTLRTYAKADLADVIEGATFPELALHQEIDRTQWYDAYLTTLLQRDVRSVASIRNPERLVQLLVSFALRVGSLINDSAIMKENGLDAKTYGKYKAVTMNTFLTFEVEPWSKPNRLNKRYVRQRKLYFTDTGLLCYVLRRSLRDLFSRDPVTAGHVFENFVATELLKQAGALIGTRLSHFNLSGGKEVDFVVEDAEGGVVGIEVKSTSSLSERDFANLRVLRDMIGERFKRGLVIYTGTEQVPFQDGLWAIPVNALWE